MLDETRTNISKKIINCYVTYKQLIEAYKFNYKMVRHGYLRPNQEQGGYRDIQTESLNDLMGKIAEFAVYNEIKERNIVCSKPSVKVYPRGESDKGYDLQLNKRSTVDVKSSKIFAESLMLPCAKFQNKNNLIEYKDNDNLKNMVIPDLFIMVNMGAEGVHNYKKDFNKKIKELCDSCINKNENENDKVPSSSLRIYISGILLGLTLAECVKKKAGIFYGLDKKNKNDKPNPNADNIPTSKGHSKLQVDNYVFPCWYVHNLNKYNKPRRYVRMLPPRRCM